VTATPTDLPAWIVVALLTEEVIRRFPAARRNPRSRTLWSVFLALDLAMITKVQAVGDFLYHLTGVDDIATLAKHLIGIAAVALLLRWVTSVVPGRMDGRREPTYRRAISSNPRRIVTWVTIVVITVIFPLAQRRTGNMEDSDFIFVQAGHLWGSLHLLLFYTYLIFGLTCASMMCAATSREAVDGPFKYGMQAVSLGCVIGATYGIIRSGYLIARLADKPFLGGDVFVGMASNFCLVICVILVVCGGAAPKWERLGEKVRAHGALNDLRPLWVTLTDAVPTVIYDAPSAAGSAHRRPKRPSHLREYWNWKDLDTRLRMRINQILDASNIVLAPYVSPDLRHRAKAAASELRLPQHVVSAYLLHEAIQRKRANEQPHDGEPVAILTGTDDPFTTTDRMLPVGHAMNDTASLGLLLRRLSTGVHT
jgi:hypothetical protein